jgi:hypothetical protein
MANLTTWRKNISFHKNIPALTKTFTAFFRHITLKKEQPDELTSIRNELLETKAELQYQKKNLQEILFQANHKLRQPIANLLGLSDLLNYNDHSPKELKKITDYFRHSILSLDTFIKELTAYLDKLINKGKSKLY